MAGFSNYMENAVLNQILGGQAYSTPSTVYVALSTSAYQEDGTGGNEPVGNNYARASVTNNTTNWPVTTTGTKTNANSITFATASGNWGSLGYVGIYDQLTGGNLLMFSTISVPKSPSAGDTVSYAPSSLTINLD